jgi:hypothetical protein
MKAYYGALKYYHDRNQVVRKNLKEIKSISSKIHTNTNTNTSVENIVSTNNCDKLNKLSLYTSKLNDYTTCDSVECFPYWPVPVKEQVDPIYINIPFNSDHLTYKD